MIIRLLLEEDNVEQLIRAIHHDNLHVARIAVRLIIQYSLISRYDLLTTCLSHDDMVIRKMASDLLCELSTSELKHLLPIGLHDPYMPIRREALQLSLKRFPEGGIDQAKQYLYDRHPAIREVVIHFLTNHDVDVEALLYPVLHSTIDSSVKLKSVIACLAEVGSIRSINRIETYCAHFLPSVRVTSIQALVRLIGEKSRPRLEHGLVDPSPRMAKESARLILKLGIRPSADDLLIIVDRAVPDHTLYICIRLARKINKWERLIFLCKACCRSSETEVPDFSVFEQELNDWEKAFNRSGVQPSASQIKQIQHAYEVCCDQFGQEPFATLKFTLGTIVA